MLEMLEPGQEVTLLSLADGNDILVPGGFDEQLQFVEMMLQSQWQLLSDMENGLTMGQAVERQTEDEITRRVTTCPQCRKTVPPNSKFCSSCGERVAGMPVG